jgi:hypothetical protein
MIKLELEQNEVQFILNALGEMPSRSGCFPLLVKVQSQAQPQVEPPKDETVVEAA